MVADFIVNIIFGFAKCKDDYCVWQSVIWYLASLLSQICAAADRKSVRHITAFCIFEMCAKQKESIQKIIGI